MRICAARVCAWLDVLSSVCVCVCLCMRCVSVCRFPGVQKPLEEYGSKVVSTNGATAEEEDDDFDPFASDDEEEEEVSVKQCVLVK